MTIEIAQEALDVVIGTFSVNSNSAIVLFYFGASHSFIAYTFIKKHGIPPGAPPPCSSMHPLRVGEHACQA